MHQGVHEMLVLKLFRQETVVIYLIWWQLLFWFFDLEINQMF